MDIHHLVKMANQIEAFFKSEPDREIAIQGISGHIKRFWDPRMRTQILAHMDAGAEGMDTLLVDALRRLR
jgi:formate dehydrogenase subunit delta